MHGYLNVKKNNNNFHTEISTRVQSHINVTTTLLGKRNANKMIYVCSVHSNQDLYQKLHK